MNTKENLLSEIIKIEWEMFQKVPNIGGRALCQDDYKTFKIMRHSQGMSWSEATLESYLNDLKKAEKNDRNLLSEKYARMMESTSPLEYDKIKHLLTPLDPDVPPLIDKIIEIALAWEEDVTKKYPYICKRGRPIYSSEDMPGVVSFETYLRGELATYSKKTIEFYYNNMLGQKSQGINGAEIVLERTVNQYGYKSLEEANEKCKPQ